MNKIFVATWIDVFVSACRRRFGASTKAKTSEEDEIIIVDVSYVKPAVADSVVLTLKASEDNEDDR